VHFFDLLVGVIEFFIKMRHLYLQLGNALEQALLIRHERLATIRATFSIDRPPT
jgi:hypothetical protein